MNWNDKINDLNSLVAEDSEKRNLSPEFINDLNNECVQQAGNFFQSEEFYRFIINYYLDNYLSPEFRSSLNDLQVEGQTLNRRLDNAQNLANEINLLIDEERERNLQLEGQNEELIKTINKQQQKIEKLKKNNSSQEEKWTQEKEGGSETVEKLKEQIKKLADSKRELKDKNKQLKEQINEAEKTEQEDGRTILNLKQKLKTQTKKIEDLEEFSLLTVRDFDEEKKSWEAEKNQFIAEKKELVYQLTLEESKRLNRSRSRGRSRSSSIYLETIDEKNTSLSKEMSNQGYKAENGRFSSRRSSRITSPYSSPTSPVVDYFTNGFLEQKEKRIQELESLLESLEETNFSLEEDNFSLREELEKVQKDFEEKWEEENNRLFKENQRLIEEINRQRQSNLSRSSSRLQPSLIDSTYYPPQGYMEKMPSFRESGSSCPSNYNFDKLENFNNLAMGMIEEGNETLANNLQTVEVYSENDSSKDLITPELRELIEAQKRKITELENTNAEETNRLRELLKETQKDLSAKIKDLASYQTLQEKYKSLESENDFLQGSYNNLRAANEELTSLNQQLQIVKDEVLRQNQQGQTNYLTTLENKQSIIDELENYLDDNDDLLGKKNQQITILNKENNQKQQAVFRLENVLNDLSSQTSSQNQTITRLNNSFNEKCNQIATLAIEKQNLTELIREKDNELNTKNRELTRAQEEIKNLEKENHQISHSLKEKTISEQKLNKEVKWNKKKTKQTN